MWDHSTFSKLYILFNFHVNCKASNIFLYHRVAAFFLYLMQDQVLETPCRIRLNIFLIFNYFNAIYTFYNTFMRNVEKLLEHTFKICGVNTAIFSKYVWNVTCMKWLTVLSGYYILICKPNPPRKLVLAYN